MALGVPGLRARLASRAARNMSAVDVLAVILVVLLSLLPFAVVGALFVWAAVKDGEEDRALQKRLGIRRRTRLGR